MYQQILIVPTTCRPTKFEADQINGSKVIRRETFWRQNTKLLFY